MDLLGNLRALVDFTSFLLALALEVVKAVPISLSVKIYVISLRLKQQQQQQKLTKSVHTKLSMKSTKGNYKEREKVEKSEPWRRR